MNHVNILKAIYKSSNHHAYFSPTNYQISHNTFNQSLDLEMNRKGTIVATKASQLLLTQLRTRLFSTTSFTGSVITEPFNVPMSSTMGTTRLLTMPARNYSTHVSSGSSKDKKEDNDTKAVSSYWGVAPPTLTKSDGSAWKWNCFRPWEAYQADTTIDVKKHHNPVTWNDKIAFWIVQALKYPTYLYFQVHTLLFLSLIHARCNSFTATKTIAIMYLQWFWRSQTVHFVYASLGMRKWYREPVPVLNFSNRVDFRYRHLAFSEPVRY
ncbi:putative ubiquinol oxidase (non-electrogenic) [Helianthus annuus]|nr:putative ubiquinol oxidase (non-electrogenic) [Helianthus annuus]KAJ0498461.1 putative ubiquinol oxidase (non-electrogenic) [Helianthus annuus]KAJ0664477.1 putative ubiquinol oxidase (non-electrogenic) [Helianthus annuus]KAJ0671927.1 putative ubiquinol oxidase (non-electrogenic) [Helianthus annuus]